MVNLLPYYAAGGDHPRHVSGDEPHSVVHLIFEKWKGLSKLGVESEG